MDNRRQVILEKKVPETINLEGLSRYMAWCIYRIVNQLEIVEEFTRYRPIPINLVPQKAKIKLGLWPCYKATKPLHLFVEGVVLLFGGMAIGDEKRVQMEEATEGKCLHQAAHSDFSNGTFPNLNRCELLNGLVKPFAVNIAVEDQRKIYIGTPEKTITFNRNEMLLVGGDTVHGGMSYFFNPDASPVEYHPSLHFVFASRRFKKDDNFVSLPQEFGDYLPAAHAVNLKNKDVVSQWSKSFEQLDELGKTAFTKERGNVGKLVYQRAVQSMKVWTSMMRELRKGGKTQSKGGTKGSRGTKRKRA